MKKVRVTKIAVNSEAMMPMESVTAKPRIGPVPNWKSTKRGEQRGELRVDDGGEGVGEALAAPRLGRLAASISSRMRSKISTLASTAMPIERTMPAMPGRVSAASTAGEGAQDQHDVDRPAP